MQQVTNKLVESARLLLKEYGFFVEHLWHVDDVHFLCEQRGWPLLNHEEAKEVFVIFSELYDGESGMTWPKLEQATQLYLAQAGRIQKMPAAQRSQSAVSIQQQYMEDDA